MATERRLIDANALLVEVVKAQALEPNTAVAKIIMLVVEAERFDAVEVVRCNDCKKWEYDENFSGWCVEWRRRTLGDHFCSYGERRSDGEVD